METRSPPSYFPILSNIILIIHSTKTLFIVNVGNIAPSPPTTNETAAASKKNKSQNNCNFQVTPSTHIKEFFAQGTQANKLINHLTYPPKTVELMVLNVCAIALATFLIEDLNESPEGQVALLVTTIFNKLQPFSAAIFSLEHSDKSTDSFPSWVGNGDMSLTQRSRIDFLTTLDLCLTHLMEIPSYTSAFPTKRAISQYYTLIHDLKNTCHILTTTPEASFMVPSDSLARRDLTRYLTTVDPTELPMSLHKPIKGQLEMLACNSLGRSVEGRIALRKFGLAAASHVRERLARDQNTEKALLIWASLHATGINQEVKHSWFLASEKMKKKRSIFDLQQKSRPVTSLRIWIQAHGHHDSLLLIRKQLLKPEHNLDRPGLVSPQDMGQGPETRRLPPTDPEAVGGAKTQPRQHDKFVTCKLVSSAEATSSASQPGSKVFRISMEVAKAMEQGKIPIFRRLGHGQSQLPMGSQQTGALRIPQVGAGRAREDPAQGGEGQQTTTESAGNRVSEPPKIVPSESGEMAPVREGSPEGPLDLSLEAEGKADKQ